MKRLLLLFIILILLLVVGFVFGQSSDTAFAEFQSLGEPRPRGIIYEPNFDRLVWVDAVGRLQIVDATTFEVQHTLYNNGFYNAYEFSHNGQYLALAIDLRFEIYDMATGTQLLSFTPDGVVRAEGPLYWSPDDTLLAMNIQVLAPQAVRTSENDTTNLPYLWDIASELGERRTILPGARAIPFFDYRNGFVYGANNTAIVGLPERLQVLSIQPSGVEVVNEIPANRFERDPIIVWSSLNDEMMYLRPNPNSSQIIQLDTATNNLVTIPIGNDINAYGFDHLEGIQSNHLSRMIGNPLDIEENSLLRFLLGTDYRRQFAYHPITVSIIDYLEPQTGNTGDRTAILLYIFDETRGIGRFDLIDSYPATGFSLSEDGNSIAFRFDDGFAQINVFDIGTGNLTQTLFPAMPEIARNGVFGFDGTGETIISDFQRFDVSSGEMIFENMHYNEGFDRFFWDDGSDKLVTVTGNRWWVWDIYTGEVIRREMLSIGDSIIGTADNGERYLVSVANDQNELGVSSTYEMVEVGMDDRVRLTFEQLPHVSIENIIFSPDGQNYLVIYSVNGNGQHAPGNEIMLYNLDAGALWHIAGDDLPNMTARRYGWLDNETIFIYSEEGTNSPQRVYGVNYHASGIPQCLADTFPQEIGEWSLVWERLNDRLPSDELNHLANATCAILPTENDVVIDLIFPSATPTRLPVTATPSTIAGVPTCLTNRFPNEARDYAVIWQELTLGLSEAEIEELEILLCENLGGRAASSSDGEVNLIANNVDVMLINIQTGQRQLGAYIPETAQAFEPNIELVNQAFRQQYGVNSDGILSPDTNFYAVRNQRNQVILYRLLTPYATYAANATATSTFIEAQEDDETYVSLRPTATQGFEYLGEPRPTFTPTVTPTPPSRPEGDLHLAQNEDIETICPYDATFTLDNPPPNFAASGRIVTLSNHHATVANIDQQINLSANETRWVLDLTTGEWRLDDRLPTCYTNNNCAFSFDKEWIFDLNDTGDFIVSRPDGSQAQLLFYSNQLEFGGIQSIQWIGLHILQYERLIPESSEARRERLQLERFDPTTGETTVVDSFPVRIEYNRLTTNFSDRQPGANRRYEVASVPFTTASGQGLRYFIYDRLDLKFIYIGRFSDISINGTMQFRWHPLGEILYYSYPDSEDTYAFFPETETFSLFGNVPLGLWSHDASSLAYTIELPTAEREALVENEQPVPNIEVWDHATGLRKRYCMPNFDFDNIAVQLFWSPDNRYIAFQRTLPDENLFLSQPVRTFILDTETGSITQISEQAGSMIVWIREVYP